MGSPERKECQGVQWHVACFVHVSVRPPDWNTRNCEVEFQCPLHHLQSIVLYYIPQPAFLELAEQILTLAN